MLYLASEGQQVLVDVLGSQAVSSVPLGLLDVAVAIFLTLEPLRATLVGAGNRTLASVQHHMDLEVGLILQLCSAASVGTGKPRWRRCVLALDVPLKIASLSASVPTSFGSAGEWPQLQVDLVHVFRQIYILGEGEATGHAFKRAMLEVGISVMTKQMK